MVALSDYVVITKDTITFYEKGVVVHVVSTKFEKTKTIDNWIIDPANDKREFKIEFRRLWFQFSIVKAVKLNSVVSFDTHSVSNSWSLLLLVLVWIFAGYLFTSFDDTLFWNWRLVYIPWWMMTGFFGGLVALDWYNNKLCFGLRKLYFRYECIFFKYLGKGSNSKQSW
jgi:hypothetical protein